MIHVLTVENTNASDNERCSLQIAYNELTTNDFYLQSTVRGVVGGVVCLICLGRVSGSM